MLRKLATVLLLCTLLSLVSVGPAAAQRDGLPGHPWWMNAASFTFSVMAVACAAIAVVELGVNPTLFWSAQVLTVALLIFGFALAEVGGIFFWMAVIATSIIVILMVSLVFAKVIVKKLVRR